MWSVSSASMTLVTNSMAVIRVISGFVDVQPAAQFFPYLLFVELRMLHADACAADGAGVFEQFGARHELLRERHLASLLNVIPIELFDEFLRRLHDGDCTTS